MNVFLVTHGVMGHIRRISGTMPNSAVGSSYGDAVAKVYERDKRLMPTVHAIQEGHDQRRLDRGHVQSDVAYASDRSCREGLCVCREVGLPEKRHPHLAT